ncbi:hypothetical protein ACOSP7_002426 [Xanthoceras sorbifolium]
MKAVGFRSHRGREKGKEMLILSVVDGGVLEWVKDTIGSMKLDVAIGVEASYVSSAIFCSDPNSFVFFF